MSFREFITSRWFRRSIADEFERYENIKPPKNPSRRYIDKLVARLLKPSKGRDAEKELSLIGPAAVPSLVEALNDPRFLRIDGDDAPFATILELLVPHAPDQVIAAATKFADSPSDEVRKTAALALASLGRAQTLPTLGKLLQDPDGYVRSYVCIGIQRAVDAGRDDEAFRRGAYELVLPQCDQRWEGNVNDAASLVVALAPTRAAEDFASPRWLSHANPNVQQILKACNDAAITLPETLVRSLLEHSLPLAVGEQCYPHQYIAAAALEALASQLHEQARPLLEKAMDHEQQQIREAAANAIALLAGVKNPVGFVLDRIEKVGFDGLTSAQRVVYCAFLFDAEVCNGGIMQFFGNSSGDYAFETLEALHKIHHPQAEAALGTAMKQVGPLAREPDREMRLAAFEDRYDELKKQFGPLEDAYYASGGLRQKLLLYAANHPDEFRENL